MVVDKRPSRAPGLAVAVVLAVVLTACDSASHQAATTPSSSPGIDASSKPTPSVAASAADTTEQSPTAEPGSPAPSGAASLSPSAPVSSSATSAGATSWLSYHADLARTGAIVAGPSLDSATKAWAADLGGVVHGQPVVADGRIIAATENNRVVALDPHTGAVLWSASLGTPLTDVGAVAGCGDIDPLGITSTPVVDPVAGTVYVVGEISAGGGVVHHRLEGLNVATGSVVLSEDVDPPLPAGERTVNLLQRTSLALANGRIYIGYGGNDGDCGNYHGWLVAVDETGAPHEVSFEVASDGQGGAIWESGGAPAIDNAGDIYVTTGNANPDPPNGGPDPKKYTESVVKLSPSLAPLASFKDAVAGGDEDLSTGNPVLLPDGDLFAIGKTDIGYLLTQSTLKQVAAIKGICGSDPDGGPAYDAATNQIFVPCKGGGIQPVHLTDHTVGKKLAGANGAPILIGKDLWAAQYPAGILCAFDAATGVRLQTISIGTTVSNFSSPSSALGLLLIGTNAGIAAFTGKS
jgi:polyvinyl alcohol dehydrogenase (cytochrome)